MDNEGDDEGEDIEEVIHFLCIQLSHMVRRVAALEAALRREGIDIPPITITLH